MSSVTSEASDISAHSSTAAGGPMFRLLRYFAITSFLAFVVVVALLGLLYRQSALGDLRALQERQHVALAQAFANSVWPGFEAFMASTAGLDGNALRARPE